MAKRVVVGMSGGVDSSVAAAILVEEGYDVIGVTLQIWPASLPYVEVEGGCCSLSAVEDARRVCQLIGIPHYVLNFQDVFEAEVIGNFVDEYRRGRTPNPCIVCNKRIKFGHLLEKAKGLDAQYVATGHYVRVKQVGDRYLLYKGRDIGKDQSYALYNLTQEQLAHSLFPLGDFTKEETRQKAAQLGLRVASKPDSQEICFIPDDDYRRFLRDYAPETLQPGPIVDAEGRVLGEHQGIAFYTIGQRKGLGISAPHPLYVHDIIPETNTIVVGPDALVFGNSLLVEDPNFISIPQLEGPLEVEAKIRYNVEPAPAVLRPSEEGVVTEFLQPQRAITPGQSAVWYQGDLVVGGGIVKSRS
ncbi:MAG: tRNA 2-thiouridine(34) synthase MnmA [Limnochordia bacterium]|jgi:tRNA-specific 2-thiouridylase